MRHTSHAVPIDALLIVLYHFIPPIYINKAQLVMVSVLMTAVVWGGGGYLTWISCRAAKIRRERLAKFRADGLPERAKHVAQVLQEATTLVEELQAELSARTTLLERAKQQLDETARRTADMQRLTEEDPEIIRIVNEGWDQVLERRIGKLERGAICREVLLGTVGAVAFGIIAILLSHYLFGF
jgi:hypothetical protein